ncbi:hypothetical protein DOTSEDRAFT_75464 [Dothistroma septosporum NZE10]|uniref:Cytochrome P450 n=1 Tax=Dothistroma septosporum (strain NZE10 / CBS 128990) TaxID=675120 RepID=M2YII4_DOTSN|nr:hypothetical protein DOTSEDRAFT_75464 [Dothistroma septosporum NZE10]
MAGAPKWLPSLAPAAQARARVISAVVEHHDALHRLQEGGSPDRRWGDMNDCSTVMVDRTKAWFAAKSPPKAYGGGDGAVFWAMNVNANQVIFWLVWYAYSQPGLLQELRDEVAPCVKPGVSTDGAAHIDMDSLWKYCPLLKGAFFETMRIEAASMSYKQAEQDFVVRESLDDAKLLGRSEPQSFEIEKGEYICIPHVVHQSDGRYFRDPDRFNPRRFWVHDANTAGNAGKQNNVTVDYKTMKVWGGGKQLCKGKTFAEREVVLFAAAVISAWEMEPVNGQWEHPGRVPTAGTHVPKKDVRVRMWKREGW